nr:hypothetical protein [uncultured Draconibacterium sp.]
MTRIKNSKVATVIGLAVVALVTLGVIMAEFIWKKQIKVVSPGSDQARGIRNNNPLNLRRTNIEWHGERKVVTDQEFEEFETMEFGLRAGLINMRTQIRNGYETLEQLINRWAPASENNTVNYVNIVSEKSGYAPTDILEFDKEEMFPVVEAMVKIESGMDLTLELYEKAWEII